jgi:hypothetical protein
VSIILAVLVLSQSVDVVEAATQQVSWQQHPQPIGQYFRLLSYRNLTIPILDHLSSELHIRFDADYSQNIIGKFI